MNIQKTVENLKANPKVIFLIDGIGALVTSFSLFGIGFWLSNYFGMPKSILYILSSIVAFYAVYSISCYFFLFDKLGKDKNWQSFLKGIIAANSLYCIVMPFLMLFHYEDLTVLGMSYFIFEIIVILVLVVFEIKLVSK
ncbi:hypothetical protein ACE193_11620 [Bernardetia sp. OM2101]|uniref:hypothetical protein n=1 Tax=Bernardetia sp. OM2101 TaxID=3344876 RepID=UPI0035CEBF6A